MTVVQRTSGREQIQAARIKQRSLRINSEEKRREDPQEINVIIGKAMFMHVWADRWKLGILGLSQSGCQVR